MKKKKYNFTKEGKNIFKNIIFPPEKQLYKHYNEYELRFLQVLLPKKIYENLKTIQTVQGMKKKKVFRDKEGIYFEHDEEKRS